MEFNMLIGTEKGTVLLIPTWLRSRGVFESGAAA